MRSVLGIDAAWTDKHTSGVALVKETNAGWELVGACSSYEQFLESGNCKNRDQSASNLLPDVKAILNMCERQLGSPVDLVAVDMPVARGEISGRRASDDAVSRTYGKYKCGTHSPNSSRPGIISKTLRDDFHAAGYPLQTTICNVRGLIEVYPHPALVELTRSTERLKYKYAKRGNYWPERPSHERLKELIQQWRRIIRSLGSVLSGGISLKMPELRQGMTGLEMKRFEDSLDAVVCAWVAICVLEGRAKPYGDEESAIWIPTMECVDVASS